MKISKRNCLFETNSSSTHALAIDGTVLGDLNVLVGIKKIEPLQSTAYPLIFDTPQKKLNYIWSMWLDSYYDQENNPDKAEKLDQAEKQIRYILKLPETVEFVRGETNIESIWHGSFFFKNYQDNPQVLIQFICSSDSFVQVGGGDKPAPVILDMMRWERDELGIEFPERPDGSMPGYYHEYKNLYVTFYGNE